MLLLLAALASAHAEEPAFGSDVSVGIAPGVVLGDWPDAGLGGAWTARYDAFVSSEVIGPRLGVSIFAGGSLWPLQDKTEEVDGASEIAPLEYIHYGALAILRYDPALRWGGTFGFGFSRLDLEDWYGGAQAVPLFVIEGGARRLLGRDGPMFLDVGLRGGWGSARGIDAAWTDWWMAQGVVALGAHLR